MGAEAVWAGVARAEAFFMDRAPVHQALAKLTRALDELKIPDPEIAIREAGSHSFPWRSSSSSSWRRGSATRID
jgi:hypothetical protein